MPYRERRQKERARAAALSTDVQAFLNVVNDGRFTFPHYYDEERVLARRFGRRGIPRRYALALEQLEFEAGRHHLHAAVREVLKHLGDQLCGFAYEGREIPRGFGGFLDHLDDAHLLSTPSLAGLSERCDLAGGFDFEKRKIQLAAQTALYTGRDALEELVVNGGYRCLRRCQWQRCQRFIFQKSDALEYCRDRGCRQAAHRERGRKVPLKGRTAL